jgi:serine-type D-Ala-D-Ala carboxypeptidase/endopeptidase (penicillin-binding protein 4)
MLSGRLWGTAGVLTVLALTAPAPGAVAVPRPADDLSASQDSGAPAESTLAMPAAPTQAADAAGSVARRLDRLLHHRLRDSRLGHDVGLLVVDAVSGAVLSAEHADRPMQAASNMKIITAVTSLATLGPAHRFRTRVVTGTQPGHLFLVGTGDPLLSRSGIVSLARRTSRALPARGAVVVHVDRTLFPAATMAPGWASAYLGNSVGFVQSLAIRGDRSRTPSRHAADLFVSSLRSHGIRARLGTARPAPVAASLVVKAPGHTVAESIAVMLSESESSVAEVLFRQVAIAAGRPPTWAGSQRAARETLEGLGIDTSRAHLVDGSGLSRDDRISPRLVASVLMMARVTQAPRFRSMFVPSAMPVAGRTGTLTQAYGRYSTSPSRCARGDVQAKTGTILGTIALSGVARTSAGTRRIFSIIVNDRPQQYDALSTRRAVDGLAATIAGCWK